MHGDSLNDYFRLEKIGEGTYGIVYKCRCRMTNKLKAMKRIKLENFDDGIPATALREIALLKEAAHPNVVDLEHIIMDRGRLFLIFEFLTLDLRKYIDKCPNHLVSPRLVQSFMYQMLQGLLFCHSRRILHRDLKPQNVLVDVEKNIVKLADFGLAKSLGYPPRKLTHEIVTLWYRAPEIMFGEDYYSSSVDMWSMGCIFAELATGEPLFRGDSEIDQLFKIFSILGVPTEENWPGVAKLRDYNPETYPSWHSYKLFELDGLKKCLSSDGLDLLSKMIVYDPNRRVSALQSLLHKYFADFDLTTAPAIGEEFVGLPLDKIPEKFSDLFKSATRISETVTNSNEDDEAEAKRMKILPSTVLLGASAFQISEAREKFGKCKDRKIDGLVVEGEEILEDAREPKKRALQPLGDNQHVNMSLD